MLYGHIWQRGIDMDGKPEKFRLPENLYNEMLKFFRRTSLPRIQRQRELEKVQAEKKDTPSGNKR